MQIIKLDGNLDDGKNGMLHLVTLLPKKCKEMVHSCMRQTWTKILPGRVQTSEICDF